MSLVLHPRAAPGDRLRVWIGAFQRTSAPALQWTLDGAPAQPVALRPIASARPAAMLGGANPPRAFTGVYEFVGTQPGRLYKVGVLVDGVRCELEARTLPAAIPSGMGEWFNVLLVSCFHAAEDRGGLAGTMVAQLQGVLRPHMTLLMGDQVYLDMPTLQDFPNDTGWLAAKFETDYIRNWRGAAGYGQVLAAAPSVSVPDDHEYWNNYPHKSPFIATTFSAGGRANWKSAAVTMFDAFQLAAPAAHGDPVEIDVHPLSFFMADTRSDRDAGRQFTMAPDRGMARFEAWCDRVRQQKLYGVFVAGQSIFDEPAGELGGSIGDYALANYGDYREIVAGLRGIVDAGRPVVCITGDVHWGRMVSVRDLSNGRTAFYEVISSPSSLVSVVGKDQFVGIGNFFKGLFGKKDPWPRHDDPVDAGPFLAPHVLQKRFAATTLHKQKGNHVGVLSFRAVGGGIQFQMTYRAIHSDSAHSQTRTIGPFTLNQTV